MNGTAEVPCTGDPGPPGPSGPTSAPAIFTSDGPLGPGPTSSENLSVMSSPNLSLMSSTNLCLGSSQNLSVMSSLNLSLMSSANLSVMLSSTNLSVAMPTERPAVQISSLAPLRRSVQHGKNFPAYPERPL